MSVDRRSVLDLSPYVFERLHEDAEFMLSRGRAERADPPSILLLAPVSAYPSLETLKKIDHEFALRPELAATWAARPFALSRYGEQLVLVRDPVQGETRGEREIIEAALVESRGRVAGPSGAAAKLGVPPSTLDHRIKALNIDKREFRPS